METIKKKYQELPPHTQELLKRKRLEWDTHTPKGIMNVVYTHYPQYKEKAMLKKRYADLDWNDDNQIRKKVGS